MRDRVRSIGALLSLFLSICLSSSGGAAKPATDSPGQAQIKNRVVYVCACLKTKSCSCMTEAKLEGPCACGTEGGPPMKPVPSDSDWAKENRDALAK
jgi:hypothetical protein